MVSRPNKESDIGFIVFRIKGKKILYKKSIETQIPKNAVKKNKSSFLLI